MKKLVVISIVAAMLLGSGIVCGQTAAIDAESHDVEVRIPEVVMIRLTSGDSNDPVTIGTDVMFDLSAVSADALIGTHAPNGSTDWDDVKVFVNRNGTWNVAVSVTHNNGPVAFPWGQISVEPSSTGLAKAFTLSTTGAEIAESNLRGWQSLGFGPQNFKLQLYGTEVFGDYSATVTYTLTAP